MLNEKILNKNDNYIVACSGGPDSMFLLSWLVKLGYKNIIALHVNYNKRKDSKNDEEIFKSYCKVNNINNYIKEVTENDYNDLIKKNKNNNFQTIARILRYNFFEKFALKYNAKILVAHNLNDHIETYLMQKERRSFVSHWGISETSTYGSNDVKIIRPMLNLKKSFIVDYLNKNNIKYAIDYTNNLAIYKRNKVRLNLNEKDFQKYISQIKNDNSKLEEQEKKVKKYYNIIVDRNIIDLKSFYKLSEDFKEKLIYHYFSVNKIFYLLSRKKKTVKELIKQLQSQKPNIFFKINNDYIFIKQYNIAYIYKKEEKQTAKFLIKNTSNFTFDNYEFIFYKTKDNEINLKLKNGYYCYFNKNDLPITVTNDAKYLKSVKIGTKFINRFLIKEKIPLIDRNGLFFLNNKKNPLLFLKYKTFVNKKMNYEYFLIVSVKN